MKVETCQKTISDENYIRLIKVFKKYKDILSDNTVSSLISIPNSGASSYNYAFEDKSNYSDGIHLFYSSDRVLENFAYSDLSDILNAIMK